ncbi:MAG: ion transporter [Leptospirales bacterium]|nr:ion transporter [Leptospirales bacterium]
MSSDNKDRPLAGWRLRLYETVYESETTAGKLFDICLLIAIVASLIVVAWESVPDLSETQLRVLSTIEWSLTVLFTFEYILRLIVVRRPLRYVASFYGLVDLVAIAPMYLAIFVPGMQYMIVWRSLRLLRVFRILKLGPFVQEASQLTEALVASRRKIIVFFSSLAILAFIFGTFMYVIEGPDNGFKSIPIAIYWAVVTMTTTGFGDIVPRTGLGQAIASFIMLLGYAILAVPTGIITAELASRHHKITTQTCPSCLKQGHETDAKHCKFCGTAL